MRSVSNEWEVDDEGLEKEVEAVCVTNENGYIYPRLRLSDLQPLILIALWRWAHASFFLGANEIFCAMTGFTKGELLGKPCTLIMPDAIAAKHDAYMANYARTGIKRLIGTFAYS